MNPSIKLSKFLSLILRHNPAAAGLTLDPNGWCDVDDLIAGCRRAGFASLTRPDLDALVAASDKQRFAFSPDGRRIRANQGHSVDVELNLPPATPPELLYHGTVERFLGAIRREGLRKMNRHHVHLSADTDTAAKVGERRGDAIILTIRAGDMHRAAIPFFLSANHVWLVDAVPPQYLQFPPTP